MATEQPDYGPSGYLPPRAAQRARKVVLRAPLGLAWVAGAAVTGVVVLVAGGLLLARLGPPSEPFVPVAEVAEVDPHGLAVLPVDGGRGAHGSDAGRGPDSDLHVLVLRGAGGVTAFRAPGGSVRWCAGSGRLEAPGGRVWEPDGRLVGGDGRSLARLPARVHDGVVYVDVTAPGSRRPPAPRGEVPVCTH